MTGETPTLSTPEAEALHTATAPVIVCASDPIEPAVDNRPPRPIKPDPERLRMCAVTRTERPPADLIRFVADPSGGVVADLARRLPGRGVWVTATRTAITEAVKRNSFAKSLKQPVRPDKDLADQVEKLLAIEARQALSLANKAGLVSLVFRKLIQAWRRA